MSDPRLAFVYSPEIERLSYPPDCPFKTQRAGLARRQMLSFGLLGSGSRVELGARRATEGELGRYNRSVTWKVAAGGGGRSDGGRVANGIRGAGHAGVPGCV